MKGTYLGEFEELVLLTVGALYPEAYGVGIMDEIAKETGRSVNISAIHSALRRLDEKGFVKSEMGGSTNERGGRRKRIFELTAFGKKALDEVQEQRMSLYNRIPNISFSS
ncbi:PadR family transcriptional regulator [Roseivirga ehrenbergii]|mgnify:CR=1 FL=1|jgi:DNA-binding PadR family transcriptional regulator|uniref:PadR family transcriptional regulator n=3 Tax=Roseivirga TaxID=290180 RepID=A0A0L8AND5_9BACT|nr:MULTISPECIES: PadR family transcriptional regulator [Roseivirga]KOF03672.1 PadR family transcriptional regulator [Roseivirga seohaensis subsp. aquiponti]KYG74844.1 PadR family transcriptional regulator [Roseivirga ehrenbergii]KYG81233.1 PadR family transcriptional regulator [Roseivirga seohaensis]TCL13821.1 PadR family transcriptional regulator [Roseivirga ehrenbergii]|tara:strand:+ start:67838 stop:68167 length:330 start_codon:yes stop_codon:yes gene_type:complete